MKHGRKMINSRLCVFFKFVCQLSGQNVRTILNSKNFQHQIIANLKQKATEIVRFLKYEQIFLKKNRWTLFKNLIYSKINKGGKFSAECVSKYTISWKCLLHPNCEVFWKSFQIWKNQKIWRKSKFYKKTFSSLKGIIKKLESGKDAVVTGRFV